MATSNAATGTAIPIAICSFWVNPDEDPVLSVPAAVLLVSELAVERLVSETVAELAVERLVSGIVAELVGNTLLDEGDIGRDWPLEAGAPDAIGVRDDPNVAVVVEVRRVPPATSGHTKAMALTRDPESST